MLPPGHFAAGFLIAKGMITLLAPNIPEHQEQLLLLWGGFFGFAPDLDMFWAFYRNKGFIFHDAKKVYHRDYLPHAPFLWLCVSVCIFLISSDPFWKFFALILGAGSWSHFLLDSFKVGIRWLWPFSDIYYAFFLPGDKKFHTTKGFFNYWLEFLRRYTTNPDYRITFVLEVIIILVAITVQLW